MAPLQTVVSYRLAALIAFLQFALVAPSAQGATILQVDVSDPSAVVFTATDALAQNTVENADALVGLDLRGFFSPSASEGRILTPALGAINVFNSTAGTTRGPLDSIIFSQGDTIMNLFAEFNFDMNFLDTARAMTGSLTADLDGFTGLPTLGASGDIFTTGLGGTLIGQYEVVPEPGTAALMGLGLAGLGVARRSRRTA